MSPWLNALLERLNSALPPEAITAAVDELTRDLLLPRLLSGRVKVVESKGVISY